MVEKWVLSTGNKRFSSPGLLGCVLFGFVFVPFLFHASSFPGFLSSSDHILQREFLYLRFTGQKKKNNNNHVLFFFIIPHSYTVSVWKAAGTRHRAGRKWELGILLGRRQERFDPRVSGQESFLSVSKVTRLPFDSGSLLMIEDNTEGLLYPMPDTQQAQTVG